MSDDHDHFGDAASLYAGTYLEFLDFRLATWKEGFARLEATVRPEQKNTVGFLHGGVIASLLDIAGAFSGSYGVSKEQVSVTINLNCNFIAPHTSDVVVVEGEIVRKTRSLFFAQARLFDSANSMLCATATGTYKTQPREPRDRTG